MLTGLVDADILVYQITSAAEEAIDWGDDVWTLHGDVKFALQMVEIEIGRLKDACGADEMVMCVSGSRDKNWRLGILPTYKNHRKSKRKPLVYPAVVEHLRQNHTVYSWGNLEADDVMGIFSSPKHVIISDDKDMMSIPGKLYRPTKDEHHDITQEEADLWHLTQTLTGDATDGYSGCPKIGPVGAKRLLEAAPTWETVISAFASQGLTEDEALVQARVARILRPGEFNHLTEEVRLWDPT